MLRYIFSIFFIFVLFCHHCVIAQQEAISLYVTDEHVIIGDILSVKIKVNGFSDIISFQSSINWDPTVLKYVGVSDFGIRDLGESNFGVTKAPQGHVRFLWEPTNSTSLSVDDGSILFSVQFETTTQITQETLIGFIDITSTPAYPTEFANSNYEIINVTSLEGSIMVVNDLTELVNLEPTPNNSCDEKAPNGSLKADVNGDFVNYSFHWYNGNTITSAPDYIGYSYINIPAGNYTLQIFDGNNDLFVESMQVSVLDAPLPPTDFISVISISPQNSCAIEPVKQTGSIEINVNDDQHVGMYNISWWKDNFENGQELVEFRDSFRAEKLFAGDYEVAIENLATGCIRYLTAVVEEEKVNLQATISSIENNFCTEGANGSASISITNSNELNPRYYWFYENDEIDTTNARQKGKIFENLQHGTYKAWVIDLNSDCFTSETIVVNQNEIYPDAIITQMNDTLFANDDQANWFRNGILIQTASPFLIPDESGNYSIDITNEYGCTSDSENLYFGITGLEELNDEITLFPNPFNEIISISNETGLLEFVKIYDMQGVLINEYYNIKDKFINMYLSSSPKGIYLINIRKDGKMITRKVMKNLSK